MEPATRWQWAQSALWWITHGTTDKALDQIDAKMMMVMMLCISDISVCESSVRQHHLYYYYFTLYHFIFNFLFYIKKKSSLFYKYGFWVQVPGTVNCDFCTFDRFRFQDSLDICWWTHPCCRSVPAAAEVLHKNLPETKTTGQTGSLKTDTPIRACNTRYVHTSRSTVITVALLRATRNQGTFCPLALVVTQVTTVRQSMLVQ